MFWILGACILVILLTSLIIFAIPQMSPAHKMEAPPGWKNTTQGEFSTSTRRLPTYWVGRNQGNVKVRAYATPNKSGGGPTSGQMFLYSDGESKELLTIFTAVAAPSYQTVRDSALLCRENDGCSEERRKPIKTDLGPAYVFHPKKGDWMINVALDENPKIKATLTVAAFNSDMKPEQVLKELREYKSE